MTQPDKRAKPANVMTPLGHAVEFRCTLLPKAEQEIAHFRPRSASLYITPRSTLVLRDADGEDAGEFPFELDTWYLVGVRDDELGLAVFGRKI